VSQGIFTLTQIITNKLIYYEPGLPCSVFSCFLFSTVFLQFTEQMKWWWWWKEFTTC